MSFAAIDVSTNLSLIIGGLALGSIYGVVALGFVLVYKSTGVLNLAQGDFLMLGAYFSVTLLVTNDLGIFLAAAAGRPEHGAASGWRSTTR